MAIFGDYAKEVLVLELASNPALIAVSSPTEHLFTITAEMNKAIPKNPPEFVETRRTLFDILSRKLLDQQQMDDLQQYCIDKGLISEKDLESTKVEVMTTRWEQLGFYPKEITYEEISPLLFSIEKERI